MARCAGAPVRHHYVHGGFKGSDLRFSCYFPPKEHYQGRFFQHVTPVPDSENLAQHASGEQDKIGFSIASGAYFLETNGGGVFGGLGSEMCIRDSSSDARSGRGAEAWASDPGALVVRDAGEVLYRLRSLP